MRTSPRGVALIQEFEGFSPVAYRDPIGIWTIGYGFIEGVREGDRITRDQARTRLMHELQTYERGVLKATGGRVTQNQFDALVSFAFNVGVAGMERSSVIRAHRRGDHQAAARAFSLWNKAGGKVWAGLTRRRAAEAALYLEQVPDDVSDPIYGPRTLMPQQVEPESRMATSPINRAATVIGGTSAVAAVAELASTVQTVSMAADTVAQAKDSAEGLGASLGPLLVPALLLAVAVLAGVIVWQRWKQRQEGWA